MLFMFRELKFNLNFQICDFGLATWLPKEWSHHNVSKFEGTFGYVKSKIKILVLLSMKITMRRF